MKYPKGWEEVAIGDVAEIINGRGFKPHEWSDTGLPIIRIQNLNGSHQFNYYSGDFNPKILIKKNQLLFAWSGSRGTSFGPHIWKGDNALLNYHTWKINLKVEIEKSYLFNTLLRLTAHVENDAHGAAALVHIQKGWIEKYKIPLPPLSEQKKIAQILSTWDRAIELLEKKIAAKEKLMQGLMQQLFSTKYWLKKEGKKSKSAAHNHELPEGWLETKLGKIGNFFRGKGISKSELTEYGMPCILYGQIYTDFHYTFNRAITNTSTETISASSKVVPGDILFTNSGESLEDIGKCVTYIGDEPIYAGGDITVFRSGKTNSTFLGYYLNSNYINSQKYSMGQGHSVVHLYPKQISQINLILPRIETQEQLGSLFTSLSNELVSLTKKKNLLIKQKKGLMQQLLTGKTRVKV